MTVDNQVPKFQEYVLILPIHFTPVHLKCLILDQCSAQTRILRNVNEFGTLSFFLCSITKIP